MCSIKILTLGVAIIAVVRGSANDWSLGNNPNGWASSPANSVLSPAIGKSLVSQPLISEPIVRIRDGTLKGFTIKTTTSRPIDAFEGIPFAEPPIRELRFRDPIKNMGWSGTRNATSQSPLCTQYDYFRNFEVHGEEDCLYLNVYRPQLNYTAEKLSDQRLLPVMVFIHGGGFFYNAGQGTYGPAYLLDRDVIMVSFNYRVGAFGFLSTGDIASPGNQGMKDQVLALKWVQTNIAAFGGDSDSVTIFGLSAGAISVQLHMLSPLSRGLFHRGLSTGGTAFSYWALQPNATQTTKALGKIFNCTGDSYQTVNCLRNVDAKEIAGAQYTFAEWQRYPLYIYGPVVEYPHPGAFMTESPEDAYKSNKAQRLPWIAGFTKDEAQLFTIGLLANSNVTADVNNEWNRVVPLILGLKESPEVNVEIARRLRARYMTSNGQLSFATKDEFARMHSDRYTFVSGLKAMRYHSRYANAPTYSYVFTYKGEHSVAEKLGQNSRDWGVMHGDDFIYLLDNPNYYPTIGTSGQDFEMTRVMIKMFSNFAEYGIPLMEDDEGKKIDIWRSIPASTSDFSPVQFLEIGLNSTMIDDPYMKSYRFWRSFNLASY